MAVTAAILMGGWSAECKASLVSGGAGIAFAALVERVLRQATCPN